jgi:fido (protein-threonine AMPylation protein)
MEMPSLSRATSLDPGEIEGLRLPHITSRQELDRWEQENISEAEEWALGKHRRVILSESYLLLFWDVPVMMKNLCADGKTWMETLAYSEDEAAARIHHRLVSIHPFSNGNGRHARLASDLLLVHVLNRPRFTWGSAGDVRQLYLEALRAADRRDFGPLLRFVRS